MFDRLRRMFALRKTSPEYQPEYRHIPLGNVTVGVRMNAPEEALKVSTVWRCVNLLGNSVATLQWDVFRIGDMGTKTKQHGHDIERLLNDEPNPEMTAFQFKLTAMHHKLLYGNFYAEIERDAMGRARALWPIAPDRVDPCRDEYRQLYFRVANPTGGLIEMPPEDIFHVPGASWDGIRGYSILEVGAQSVGAAYTMDQFAGAFFANGMTPSGFVEVPEGVNLSPEALARLKDEFMRKHQGRANQGKPLILDQGMKWHQLAVDADKGQFLDTRKFTVYDICRWFGVPPYLAFASDEEPRANVETQSREFLQYGLDPHINAFQQEADRKLFTGYRPKLKTFMNVDEFLLADVKARSEYYTSMRQIGVLTVNQILQKEGYDPIGPEGDVRVMQVQYQPVGNDGAPKQIDSAAMVENEPPFATSRRNGKAIQ